MPTTLGTAHLAPGPEGYLLRYLNIGSFLECRQHFTNINAALRFCREHRLRVTAHGMEG